MSSDLLSLYYNVEGPHKINSNRIQIKSEQHGKLHRHPRINAKQRGTVTSVVRNHYGHKHRSSRTRTNTRTKACEQGNNMEILVHKRCSQSIRVCTRLTMQRSTIKLIINTKIIKVMTQADQILVSIIHSKCDHVQDFYDSGDPEAAEQALEEIQTFCKWLLDGSITNIPADTKEKQDILWDLITTRRIDDIL